MTLRKNDVPLLIAMGIVFLVTLIVLLAVRRVEDPRPALLEQVTQVYTYSKANLPPEGQWVEVRTLDGFRDRVYRQGEHYFNVEPTGPYTQVSGYSFEQFWWAYEPTAWLRKE